MRTTSSCPSGSHDTATIFRASSRGWKIRCLTFLSLLRLVPFPSVDKVRGNTSELAICMGPIRATWPVRASTKIETDREGREKKALFASEREERSESEKSWGIPLTARDAYRGHQVCTGARTNESTSKPAAHPPSRLRTENQARKRGMDGWRGRKRVRERW